VLGRFIEGEGKEADARRNKKFKVSYVPAVIMVTAADAVPATAGMGRQHRQASVTRGSRCASKQQAWASSLVLVAAT